MTIYETTPYHSRSIIKLLNKEFAMKQNASRHVALEQHAKSVAQQSSSPVIKKALDIRM